MDELDLEDFKHGGANITGFRQVDPEFPRTKETQKEWAKLNADYWRGAGISRKIKVHQHTSLF